MSSPRDVVLDLGNGLTICRYQRQSDIVRYARHANNYNIWLNLRDGFPHPYTEADGLKWIEIVQSPENQVRSGKWTSGDGANGPALPMYYCITVNDEPVGGIGLAFGKDNYFRTAELGYWLSEEHWGKGIMSKVAPAFVEWSWKTFGVLTRLNAEVVVTNQASIKSLEKAGFVLEGSRKKGAVKAGKFQDLLFYGVLRPE